MKKIKEPEDSGNLVFLTKVIDICIERAGSMSELARIIKTSPPNISFWRNGFGFPSEKNAISIARYAGVSDHRLLRRKGRA